jgi:hypothetical protein
VVALLALVCLAFFPPVDGSADSSRLFLDATVDLKLRGLTLECRSMERYLPCTVADP